MPRISRLTYNGCGACLVALLFCSAPAYAGKEPLPDAELLEFLGRYETSNGKAIDPLQFANDQDPAKKQTTTASSTKDDSKSSSDWKKQRKDGRYEK